jgi:Flp pilus assembly pilin Flp
VGWGEERDRIVRELRRLPDYVPTDEAGAVSTEYGLLLALVARGIVAANAVLGTAIAGMFTDACGGFSGASC